MSDNCDSDESDSHDLISHYTVESDSGKLNPTLFSPLMLACYQNDVKRVTEAIARGKKLNRHDYRGYTALHYAAESGSVDVLKILVKQPGIQLDVENCNRETPLLRALELCDKPEAIDVLLNAGASTESVSCFGEIPLLVLLRRKNVDCRSRFLMARSLLEKGDVDIEDKAKVLMKAVELYKRFPFFQYDDWLNLTCMLLYYGADVNFRRNLEHNAVSLALRLKCHELCSLMLPHVTDFNAIFETVDEQFNTLFMLAVKHKSPHVFYMIERGADINFGNGLESCLKLSMTHSMRLFEYIFTRCEDETILNERAFINVFFMKNYFVQDEFIRSVHLIFGHRLVADLFADSDVHQIHLQFITTFCQFHMTIDDQVKILYCLLTYCNRLTTYDLCEIYSILGYDERFEAFLRVGIVIKDLKNVHLQQDMLIKCLCFPDAYQPQSEEFPSLQALSRNCIRRNIRKDLIYGPNNVAFKYYNYLMKLNVPLIVKDTLTLKRLV